MIALNNLRFTYTFFEGRQQREQVALDDVSLTIAEGQFIAIIGPNGSGKSTLAKHLNGLYHPSAGQVTVDGIATTDQDRLAEIRRLVGTVFQNPDNQLIGATVEEDVAFGPENQGLPADQIRQIVEANLRAVGLWHKRRESPHQLSGGQKQRVAIAGALAQQSKYLVLDEPTAMLDFQARQDLIQTAVRLNQEQGTTIILITHHADEVIWADQVVMMDAGRIIQTGTPQEIFADLAALTQLHLDIPQVTALANALAQAGLDLGGPILSGEKLIQAIMAAYNARQEVI